MGEEEDENKPLITKGKLFESWFSESLKKKDEKKDDDS
jgi:hypothetical protein